MNRKKNHDYVIANWYLVNLKTCFLSMHVAHPIPLSMQLQPHTEKNNKHPSISSNFHSFITCNIVPKIDFDSCERQKTNYSSIF